MKVWSMMLLLLLVMPVSAHQPSTAFLELSGDRTQATLQWALTDLQRAVGVDHNRDGQLLWSEVVQAKTAIESYIRESLTLSAQDQACSVQLNGPLLLNPRSEGGYLVLPLRLACRSETGQSQGPDIGLNLAIWSCPCDWPVQVSAQQILCSIRACSDSPHSISCC